MFHIAADVWESLVAASSLRECMEISKLGKDLGTHSRLCGIHVGGSSKMMLVVPVMGRAERTARQSGCQGLAWKG